MPRERCGLVLCPARAAQIYMLKVELLAPNHCSSSLNASKIKGQSAHIGEQYNVSATTIQDIWNHRTWTFATSHLWHITDQSKLIGRYLPFYSKWQIIGRYLPFYCQSHENLGKCSQNVLKFVPKFRYFLGTFGKLLETFGNFGNFWERYLGDIPALEETATELQHVILATEQGP
jgi:hypothetical protein